MTLLLALHGYSQTATRFRRDLDPLLTRLPTLEPLLPSGPHECSLASVERLYSYQPRAQRPPPPYHCWWDASDDGRSYRGWEASVDSLRSSVGAALGARAPRFGVLGFSQGAMMAALLAALAARDEFPRPSFVVLVAGRTPRASDLRPLFEATLPFPSLHVWGERDPFAKYGSAALAERFAPEPREQCVWPGPHLVPTRGPAADAIVEFVGRHA